MQLNLTGLGSWLGLTGQTNASHCGVVIVFVLIGRTVAIGCKVQIVLLCNWKAARSSEIVASRRAVLGRERLRGWFRR